MCYIIKVTIPTIYSKNYFKDGREEFTDPNTWFYLHTSRYTDQNSVLKFSRVDFGCTFWGKWLEEIESRDKQHAEDLLKSYILGGTIKKARRYMKFCILRRIIRHASSNVKYIMETVNDDEINVITKRDGKEDCVWKYKIERTKCLKDYN